MAPRTASHTRLSIAIGLGFAAPIAFAHAQDAMPSLPGASAVNTSPLPGSTETPRPSELPARSPTPSVASTAIAPAVVAPAPKPSALGSVLTSFGATFYGFIESDSIYDSTQSLNDLAGNAPIARDGTFAENHGRMTFSVRNSRFGFRLTGPHSARIRTSGIAEMDFLGNQPQSSPAPAGSPSVSEGSYFTSPTLRIRHFALKLETPIVDVLAGQYWQLFGWQSLFHPNTVEYQGVPGQIYSRSPQIRFSHLFKTAPVSFEFAVAASRPPQRDSVVPDGQAGLRVMVNDWKGQHTAGATGTAVDPLSVGVSGLFRRFRVPEFSATPQDTLSLNGWGVSVDALIPVIPVTSDQDLAAFTLTGSFVYGRSIADLYTGLSGGATFPSLPPGTTGSYAQDVDNGLVVFSTDGVLHAIYWESYMLGAQYYLLRPVRTWISGNYSHMKSNNIHALGTSTTNSKIFDKSDWASLNLFLDANAAVRFGLEYAWFRQTYLDGVQGTNHRVQFAAFYIF
jgi:hypothetical protein